MQSTPKIPAYKIRISDEENRTLVERDVQNGPTGDDAALLHHPLKRGSYIAARLKTQAGDVYVTSRAPNFVRHGEAAPQKDVFVAQPDGKRYKVTVEALPEERWAKAAQVVFAPPLVSVRRSRGGFFIDITPQQIPCVITCAIGDNGIKNEALPIVPFPTQPRHTSACVYLRDGEMGAVAGANLRIGVRGAGMSVTLPLPAQGQVNVAEDAWEKGAPAQPALLREAYVVDMYHEAQQKNPPRYT